MSFMPHSMHNWRQSDCVIFAMMNYFEPKVFNMLVGEGNALLADVDEAGANETLTF